MSYVEQLSSIGRTNEHTVVFTMAFHKVYNTVFLCILPAAVSPGKWRYCAFELEAETTWG